MRSPGAPLLPMLLLLALGLTTLLGSCTSIRTGAIDPASIARICQSWPVVTYSTKDTPKTQEDAKASNAARTGFCSD